MALGRAREVLNGIFNSSMNHKKVGTVDVVFNIRYPVAFSVTQSVGVNMHRASLHTVDILLVSYY